METGTLLFLVRLWTCFVYPPLLHIEASSDDTGINHNIFLSQSVWKHSPFPIFQTHNRKRFKLLPFYSLYVYESVLYIHHYYILRQVVMIRRSHNNTFLSPSVYKHSLSPIFWTHNRKQYKLLLFYSLYIYESVLYICHYYILRQVVMIRQSPHNFLFFFPSVWEHSLSAIFEHMVESNLNWYRFIPCTFMNMFPISLLLHIAK